MDQFLQSNNFKISKENPSMIPHEYLRRPFNLLNLVLKWIQCKDPLFNNFFNKISLKILLRIREMIPLIHWWETLFYKVSFGMMESKPIWIWLTWIKNCHLNKIKNILLTKFQLLNFRILNRNSKFILLNIILILFLKIIIVTQLNFKQLLLKNINLIKPLLKSLYKHKNMNLLIPIIPLHKHPIHMVTIYYREQKVNKILLLKWNT